MTFETFDLRAIELKGEDREKLFQAVRLARRFAQNPSGWLVFVGGYGVGKTHLAAAIANEAVAHGHEALFIVVPDLLDHLRATFNPSSPVSYDKRFEQVRRAELLVLDDLGTHSATPWAQEKLFQLFNHRYMARLPTVITMNNVETVDPRLLERMMEMKMVGAGSLIKLDIPPYRGLAKRKPHPPNM
ncbi:MAG: AAA family ATPase [Ardenticatenia bacterium]|nr:MAG: AAA family ATPase [Ardenticatenia bacterium]